MKILLFANFVIDISKITKCRCNKLEVLPVLKEIIMLNDYEQILNKQKHSQQLCKEWAL